jgi:hypothetical protein
MVKMDQGNDEFERSAFVLHLDMTGWRRLNEASQSMECLTPHRVWSE